MESVLTKSSLLAFPLADLAVNRYEKERRADGFIASHISADANPCVVVCTEDGSKVLLDGAPTRWLHPAAPPSAEPFLSVPLAEAVYVGEDTTQPRNVFVVGAKEVESEYAAHREWVSPMLLFGLLNNTELALLGLALSMKQWAALNPFCARCGGAMQPTHLGMTRTCASCKTRIYPTVLPAMIVAVLDGRGNVILSQRRRRSIDLNGKPMRTILSGFVAQGESMEETVVREVMEETGAAVTRVRYVGSQPWPTPFELMTCYYAVAENSPDLVVEEAELISVHWVPKEEVRQALAGQHPDFSIVPSFSAANMLLTSWVNGLVDDRGEAVAAAPQSEAA